MNDIAAIMPVRGGVFESSGPGLFEAHRLVHRLNGALLAAVGAVGGISVQLGSPGEPDMAPGIWTVVLRSDLDGPGGIFAMVAPAAMAWGMPEACSEVRTGKSWNTAALDVLAALDAAAAAGLPVAVRTGLGTMALVDGATLAIAPGVFAHFGPGQAVAAPLAYRLS